jgi:hypothetical protein
MNAGKRLGAALEALPPICGAPLGTHTLERCSHNPDHDGPHGRRKPLETTIHYDVRVVNPERPIGVRMMIHVPTREVPRLIRELASGLITKVTLVSVPVDGDFHIGTCADVQGATKD